MSSRALLIAATVALVACGGRAVDGASGPIPECSRDCDTPSDAGAVLDSGTGGTPPDIDAGATDAGPVAPDADAEAAGGAADEADAGGAGGRDGGVSDACTHFASSVVDHAFGGGQNNGQVSAFPAAILGPPVGNDARAVVSLGNGGWVVLAFGDSAVIDGPGADFTVFENPLRSFKELATVAVSEDGVTWTEFPCTAVPVSGQPTDYGYCAGVEVVRSTPQNGIDPLDPEVSGGDHYDLADVHVTRARYVRITDRVDLTGNDGVFDLDAVALVHAACE